MYPANFGEERRGLPKKDISEAAWFMNPSTVKPHRKNMHTEKKTGKVGTALQEGISEFWLILFFPHASTCVLQSFLGWYVNTVTYTV